MSGRMKNPKISGKNGYISILIDDTYPANKEGVVVKSQDNKAEKYFMKATGFDELKGYLYFTTYSAGKLDTDNEFMKSEDIDFMHDDLMKNFATNRMADINHNKQRLNDVWINEIWKETDKDGKTIASKGAYYIKDNAFLMEKAKAGKINGVSIMGEVEEIVDEPLSKSDTWLEKLKKLFAKSTLEDFQNNFEREARAWWHERLWTAFFAFKRNVLKWDENIQEDTLIVTKEQYEKEIDEFAIALKSIDFGTLFIQSNNMEPDMTKEEIQKMTDEQLTALGVMRITETPKAEPKAKAEPETPPAAPETVLKSTHDEIVKKSEDLVKANEALTAENEKLKKDNDILLKAKSTKPNTDAEAAKVIKEITAQDFAKMSNAERTELKVVNPKLYEKLSKE